MTVSASRIQAGKKVVFFEILRRSSAEAGKKLATKVLENPGSASQITSNIATAAATRNPRNVISTPPDVIHFNKPGK